MMNLEMTWVENWKGQGYQIRTMGRGKNSLSGIQGTGTMESVGLTLRRRGNTR